MKKSFLIFTLLFITAFSYTAQAQLSLTINCQAGTVNSLYHKLQFDSYTGLYTIVTNLTVTGTIDAYDFYIMAVSPKLKVIDLSGTTVVAYSGGVPGGTPYIEHKQNELPEHCVSSICETFIWPSSITSIGYRAFDFENRGVSKLTGMLTIPATVTSIGDYAFQRSSFTGTLTIPASVTSIGKYAFRGAGFTGSFTIPDSLTKIGQYSFALCNATSLTIPASATSIGFYAFGGLSNLKTINAFAPIPVNGDYLFDDIRVVTYYDIKGVDKTKCILHVPVGSKALYKAAYAWKDFLNIVDDLVPTSIEEVLSSTVTIYPNPANSVITISELGSLASAQAVMLSIIDVSGTTVLTNSVEPNTNSLTINVSSLKSGVYFIVIQTNNGQVVKRFVKG